jgi:hypothetical protein
MGNFQLRLAILELRPLKCCPAHETSHLGAVCRLGPHDKQLSEDPEQVAHFESHGKQFLFESRNRPSGQDLHVSVKGLKSPDFTEIPEVTTVGSIGKIVHKAHFDLDVQAKQYLLPKLAVS